MEKSLSPAAYWTVPMETKVKCSNIVFIFQKSWVLIVNQTVLQRVGGGVDPRSPKWQMNGLTTRPLRGIACVQWAVVSSEFGIIQRLAFARGLITRYAEWMRIAIAETRQMMKPLPLC